jgi:hypothetical protein
MKKYNVLEKQTTRHILLIAFAAALAAAFVVALAQPVRADNITPPPVPDNIKVPAGNKVFLVGHAIGTQNYICLPSSTSISGFAFTLFTPQATLFNDPKEQIITHFFSPNPDENGTVRATWESSQDTSMVWAMVVPKDTRFPGDPGGSSTDPNFVESGAVAWLLLQKVGVKDGPTGGDRLTATTFVQRLNTKGGVAPSTGCASLADVGSQRFVPYKADYFFYK